MRAPDAMLTVKQIADRGWSRPMIDMFLGEPDKHAPNRRSRAAPIRLYAKSRVETAETTEAFVAGKQAHLRRLKTTGTVAKARAAGFRSAAHGMSVGIDVLSPQWVRKQALRNLQARKAVNGDFSPAPDDPAIVTLITVDFIRDNLTAYDRQLEKAAADLPDIVLLIRRKVFEAIADAYPHLADECRRRILNP